MTIANIVLLVGVFTILLTIAELAYKKIFEFSLFHTLWVICGEGAIVLCISLFYLDLSTEITPLSAAMIILMLSAISVLVATATVGLIHLFRICCFTKREPMSKDSESIV